MGLPFEPPGRLLGLVGMLYLLSYCRTTKRKDGWRGLCVGVGVCMCVCVCECAAACNAELWRRGREHCLDAWTREADGNAAVRFPSRCHVKL